VTVSLTANALTTLTAFKTAWGVSGTADDEQIKRAINISSDRIANYCGRSFGYAAVSDEEHAGMGTKLMSVDRPPIIGSITSITHDDNAVDSSTYEIANADAGLITSVYGAWAWDADRLDNIGMDKYVGAERKLYKISYNGGWVLPKDAEAGSVTGTETENFVAGAEMSLVYVTDIGTTTTTIAADTYTAVEMKALIDAAISAGGLADSECSVVAGAIKLQHISTDSDNTLQVTAGDAATLLGLDSDEHAGTRTLPWDLEHAGIEAAAAVYLGFGTSKNIESEKLLNYSVKYNLAAQAGGLPVAVADMLAPYRRVL